MRRKWGPRPELAGLRPPRGRWPWDCGQFVQTAGRVGFCVNQSYHLGVQGSPRRGHQQALTPRHQIMEICFKR